MTTRNNHLFGTVEAVKRIGVSPERLRYWERAGIVKPAYVQRGTRRFRRFSEEDIQNAILVRKLVDEHKYTLEGAISRLSSHQKGQR